MSTLVLVLIVFAIFTGIPMTLYAILHVCPKQEPPSQVRGTLKIQHWRGRQLLDEAEYQTGLTLNPSEQTSFVTEFHAGVAVFPEDVVEMTWRPERLV